MPNIWSKEALRDAAAADFGETEEKVHIPTIFNDRNLTSTIIVRKIPPQTQTGRNLDIVCRFE